MSDSITRVFCSNHWTPETIKFLVAMLSNGKSTHSTKVAWPQFNRPGDNGIQAVLDGLKVVKVDVPTFGPAIVDALNTIICDPTLVTWAANNGVELPEMGWNLFALERRLAPDNHHGTELPFGRATPLFQWLRDANQALLGGAQVAERMETFVSGARALFAEHANNPTNAMWDAFIVQHVPADWKTRTHYDYALQLFGASDELAARMKVTKVADGFVFSGTGRAESPGGKYYATIVEKSMCVVDTSTGHVLFASDDIDDVSDMDVSWSDDGKQMAFIVGGAKNASVWSSTTDHLSEVRVRSMTHDHFRWIPNLLTSRRLEGCMTDIACLAFATTNTASPDKNMPGNMVEALVVETLHKFLSCYQAGTLNWVPSIIMNDRERDDTVVLALMKAYTAKRAAELEVYTQLPADPAFVPLVEAEKAVGHHVILDADSANGKVLKECYGIE